jgi:hypothetical protein
MDDYGADRKHEELGQLLELGQKATCTRADAPDNLVYVALEGDAGTNAKAAQSA